MAQANGLISVIAQEGSDEKVTFNGDILSHQTSIADNLDVTKAVHHEGRGNCALGAFGQKIIVRSKNTSGAANTAQGAVGLQIVHYQRVASEAQYGYFGKKYGAYPVPDANVNPSMLKNLKRTSILVTTNNVFDSDIQANSTTANLGDGLTEDRITLTPRKDEVIIVTPKAIVVVDSDGFTKA